ncbi:unnamed protein product, partial [Adineta steineri]
MNSFDQQQIEDAVSHSTSGMTSGNNNNGLSSSNLAVGGISNGSLSKKSKNIFKNVNRLRWGKSDRQHSSTSRSEQQQGATKRINSPTVTTAIDELGMPSDAISL